MNIPVNVDVYCSDGLCGRSRQVIVNPTTKQVTHLVINEKHAPHTAFIVPINKIMDSTPDMVRLDCTLAGLATMEPFIHIDTIQNDAHSMGYPAQEFEIMGGLPMGYVPFPHGPGGHYTVTVKTAAVPDGEIALTHGAHIHASDGPIGRLDGFLADAVTGQISHLILREGHLWGRKEVVIPVAQIDHMQEENVYLKVNKAAMDRLLATQVPA